MARHRRPRSELVAPRRFLLLHRYLPASPTWWHPLCYTLTARPIVGTPKSNLNNCGSPFRDLGICQSPQRRARPVVLRELLPSSCPDAGRPSFVSGPIGVGPHGSLRSQYGTISLEPYDSVRFLERAIGVGPHGSLRSQYGTIGLEPYDRVRFLESAIGVGPAGSLRSQHRTIGLGPHGSLRSRYGSIGLKPYFLESAIGVGPHGSLRFLNDMIGPGPHGCLRIASRVRFCLPHKASLGRRVFRCPMLRLFTALP